MFRGSVKSTGFPLHFPVSPFTCPPVCHVPSHFNWTLPLHLEWMLLKLTACSCRNMIDLSAPHDTICSWSCEFRKRTAVMEDEWSSNVWTKLYSCNETSLHDVTTTPRKNFTTQILFCHLTAHWHFHLMTKRSQFVSILRPVLPLHQCQLLLQPLLNVFTNFLSAG